MTQRTDQQVIDDYRTKDATTAMLRRLVRKSIRGQGRGAMKAAIARAVSMPNRLPPVRERTS